MFAYRIVVEAVTNCGRHAHARKLRLGMRTRGAWLRGVVADDGAGFSKASVASGRFGLRVVRERAEHLGDRARIRSAPGHGTAVFSSCPSRRDRPANALCPVG